MQIPSLDVRFLCVSLSAALLVLIWEWRQCSALSPDGWALLYFRSRIVDDPKGILLHWNAHDEDPCQWSGIGCSNGNVVSIKLAGYSLKGFLAPELGQIATLKQLVLRENRFTGVIPTELGDLENLEVLDLAFNKLTGRIPEDLGNLSCLHMMYLENNNLEGLIPSEFGNVLSLHDIRLNSNKLAGMIPRNVDFVTLVTKNDGQPSASFGGLCNLKFLQKADFGDNYLEGQVPACLHHIPRSSFRNNCLTHEGLPQQRSLEDCSGIMRRVLQSLKGAEAVVPAPVSDTNGSPGSIALTPAVNAPRLLANARSPASSPSQQSAAQVPSIGPVPGPASISSSPSPMKDGSSHSEKDGSSHSYPSWVLGVGITAAVLVIIAALTLFFCYWRKGAAARPWKSSMSGELQKGFVKGVPSISRAELEAACEDFSNIIGSSPDSVLFKGTLADGTEVAVASIRVSSKSWSTVSELTFWRKVESLSQQKHKNLVNLVGYCAEEDPFVRMLVFEYASNGTVFEHIHNKASEHLDWATRMRIVMGVSYALEYMHHELDPPISHMNFDSSVIYLTEDYASKLADFGVWKTTFVKSLPLKSSSKGNNSIGHDELELSDRLTPDFESNIHNFGIFLLEIISGKLPREGSLAELVKGYLDVPESMVNLVDPTLKNHNTKELEAICNMACKCIQLDSSSGLTMKQIASDLGKALGISKDASSPKASPSPLLWAELEILSQE